MGCCYSLFCKDDNSSQSCEPNERTHLLVDPVSNNSNLQTVDHDDYLSRNLNSLPKKTDEQTALNRILQETANNMIDVAALDSHNLQQNEYDERVRFYHAKVHQICALNKNRILNKMKTCLLRDIPNPEEILCSGSLSSEDVKLITNASKLVEQAMTEIKVKHQEDIVEPLGPPS